MYNGEPIRAHCWSALTLVTIQIFYSPDAQIEADALETFRTMIVTLYPESKENSIDLAQEIIKECQEILQEPEKSKAKPATKILSGLIFASRRSRRLVSVKSESLLTSHIGYNSQCRSLRLVSGPASAIPPVSY